MISSDLVEVAWLLARHPSKGKLKQAHTRRAISTAYYALFHALATLCANELVGAGKSKSLAWARTYRALEHSFVKSALIDLARRTHDKDIELLSEAFILLQQTRYEADYDPQRTYTGLDGPPSVRLAEYAILGLSKLTDEMKLELATTLVMRTRR
ncbi:hypothetical protein [Blastochloris sulfoviridis]|uniref:HEPN domain-containing protein n=1 Tax=Blastochloris sulfoviridis TaxID=50712 RepID=A0A5M6I112_9HYPH|nr:hypothetical protein [Blastochloris sulfoviridis]KAA5601852.1 hypothetical protein F1193_07945 [Blastochloris sulfoviridis]